MKPWSVIGRAVVSILLFVVAVFLGAFVVQLLLGDFESSLEDQMRLTHSSFHGAILMTGIVILILLTMILVLAIVILGLAGIVRCWVPAAKPKSL